MFSHETRIALPPWIDAAIDGATICSRDDDKMALTIRLAALNVEHDLGGPFGAAVFEQGSGRLVAVGVNRVLEHGAAWPTPRWWRSCSRRPGSGPGRL